MEQAAAIGNSFVQHYYSIFDQNRANLASIYQPQSILTWEGKSHIGGEHIVKHLVELTFSKVQRKTTVDVQPTLHGILITVTGTLIIDGEVNNLLKFVQIFNLVSHEGTFLLMNDFFRLILD